jgi:hypothetical protein
MLMDEPGKTMLLPGVQRVFGWVTFCEKKNRPDFWAVFI